MTFNLSTFQIYNNMATQTNQKQLIAPSKGEIILYQTADGRTSIDVKLENETVWLSSEQMALLFERDRTVIQRHIRNIYNEGELTRDTTCAKFAHMIKQRRGKLGFGKAAFGLGLFVIIFIGFNKVEFKTPKMPQWLVQNCRQSIRLVLLPGQNLPDTVCYLLSNQRWSNQCHPDGIR